MPIISAAARAHQLELLESFLVDLSVDRADATVETYASILRRANAELPAGVLCSNTAELKAWIWRPGRAANTKKTYRAAIAALFTWATDPAAPVVDLDPTRGLPRVKVQQGAAQPPSHEQLADILARAGEPYRGWMILASAMGFRCVEISRLDRDHITAEQTWIQGKGGRNVYLPTHQAVWALVKDLPSGPIARDHAGDRATRRQVYTRGNRRLRRLGYQGLTMHKLRKWFGTHVYRVSGRDILVAQRGLRHVNLNTTRLYLADEPEALGGAMAALPLPV
jgi:integrase/recombinase XerC